jgi:hypothetical protein
MERHVVMDHASSASPLLMVVNVLWEDPSSEELALPIDAVHIGEGPRRPLNQRCERLGVPLLQAVPERNNGGRFDDGTFPYFSWLALGGPAHAVLRIPILPKQKCLTATKKAVPLGKGQDPVLPRRFTPVGEPGEDPVEACSASIGVLGPTGVVDDIHALDLRVWTIQRNQPRTVLAG